MINTLQILEKVGNSIIGTANVSPRMPWIEIGKCMPCVHSYEDAEALLRCNFLDPSVPSEFNLLSTSDIQKKLWKYYLAKRMCCCQTKLNGSVLLLEIRSKSKPTLYLR